MYFSDFYMERLHSEASHSYRPWRWSYLECQRWLQEAYENMFILGVLLKIGSVLIGVISAVLIIQNTGVLPYQWWYCVGGGLILNVITSIVLWRLDHWIIRRKLRKRKEIFEEYANIYGPIMN